MKNKKMATVDFAKNLKELLLRYEDLEESYLQEGISAKPYTESQRMEKGKPPVYLPEPMTNPERLRRLKDLDGKKQLEYLKYQFGGKFEFKEPHILEEINDIEEFISKAEKFRSQKAFEARVREEDRRFVEYQRLNLDYYNRDRYGDEPCNYHFGSRCCEVYTRCFLWLPFLKALIHPPKPVYSGPTVAMALIIKDITINKAGIGVNDKINYTEKFNIESQNTLYQNWNNLIKDPIAQNKYRAKAVELIKNEGL